MTIQEAVAILNQRSHRDGSRWNLIARGEDLQVIFGDDDREYLTEFEVIAIAEKYRSEVAAWLDEKGVLQIGPRNLAPTAADPFDERLTFVTEPGYGEFPGGGDNVIRCPPINFREPGVNSEGGGFNWGPETKVQAANSYIGFMTLETGYRPDPDKPYETIETFWDSYRPDVEPLRIMLHSTDRSTGKQTLAFTLPGVELVRITAEGIVYAEGYDPDPLTRRLWETFREGLVAHA